MNGRINNLINNNIILVAKGFQNYRFFEKNPDNYKSKTLYQQVESKREENKRKVPRASEESNGI